MLEKEYLKLNYFTFLHIHTHIMCAFNRISCLEGRMTQNCEGKGRRELPGSREAGVQ